MFCFSSSFCLLCVGRLNNAEGKTKEKLYLMSKSDDERFNVYMQLNVKTLNVPQVRGTGDNLLGLMMISNVKFHIYLNLNVSIYCNFNLPFPYILSFL